MNNILQVSGHPCDPEPEELENQFSIGNSLWFTIVSTLKFLINPTIISKVKHGFE